MKKYIIPAAVFFWIAAAVLFMIYVPFSVSSRIFLTPRDHLIFSAVIICLVYFGGRILYSSCTGNTEKIMRITIFSLFFFYLAVLLILTLFDSYYGREGISHITEAHSVSWIASKVNTVPFKTIRQYVRGYRNGYVSSHVFFTNLFGNSVAFIPFAFFLPPLFRPLNKFRYFAAATAGAVVMIELLQLVLSTGSCDIDDFILNTAGAFAAFGIFHIPPVRRFINKITVICY